MELVVVVARQDLSKPWRPLHVLDGELDQEVTEAIADGLSRFGPGNATAVNVRIRDAEINALTQWTPAPEAPAPAPSTATESPLTSEAGPASSSSSRVPEGDWRMAADKDAMRDVPQASQVFDDMGW